MFIFHLDYSDVCMNTMVCSHESYNSHLHAYAPVKAINGNLFNLVGFKTLNIQYPKTIKPIDLIFTHMIEWGIRILYIKYLSNLINL